MKRFFGLIAAGLLYGAASMALFYHRGLITGADYLGQGPDPFLYIWVFKFLPAAIAHFHNPLILPQAWAPYGLNITQATTTPFLALLAWPLTSLAGPVVSFNILTLAVPCLAALAAFLLAEELTGAWLPAFIGGWMFGFSSAVFGPMLGHLQTDFVALIPLIFLILLRRLKAKISFGSCLASLSLLGVCQFLTSLETYVTLAIFMVIFSCTAQYGKLGRGENILRRSRENLLIPVFLSFLITGLVTSPYSYYFFVNHAETPPLLQVGGYYTADLLNFIIPTPLTWAGGQFFASLSHHFAGNPSEQLGYIGLPLTIILVIAIRRSWAAPLAKPMIVTMLAALVFSLGASLHIAGKGILPLPWLVLQHLPLLGNALPSRLMIFAMLFIAAICALWLARIRRFYPLACAAVFASACLAIPASRSQAGAGFWDTPYPAAALFQNQAYKTLIPPGQTVLVLPFTSGSGSAMVWQTESAGYFHIINGYGNFIPYPLDEWPATDMFRTAADIVPAEPAFVKQFNNFMKSNDVRYVIVPQTLVPKWNGFLNASGWAGQAIGNLTLYHVPDAAWADIATSPVQTARRAFDDSHLAALQQAAACLLRLRTVPLSIRAAIDEHCLDGAFGLLAADPYDHWDSMGGWLGNVKGEAGSGLGLLADGAEARRIVAAVAGKVTAIRYPYPARYDPAKSYPMVPQLLVLIYDPAVLQSSTP